MNNENNDPHWKEIADHLRKLNVDFYWRSRDMINAKKTHYIATPSRPVRKAGMGISMSLRQEHTPPVFTEDNETTPSQKSENEDRKRNSSERWLR